MTDPTTDPTTEADRSARGRGADPTAIDDALDAVEVRQVLRIAASAETVWAHWTDPARLAAWWGEAETDPRPDGSIRVTMAEGPVMVGRYLTLDAPRHLTFSFGWEQFSPGTPLSPGTTVVDVTLEPDGTDTVLTLVHRLPATHAADHERGWRRYLPALVVAAGARRAS